MAACDYTADNSGDEVSLDTEVERLLAIIDGFEERRRKMLAGKVKGLYQAALSCGLRDPDV